MNDDIVQGPFVRVSRSPEQGRFLTPGQTLRVRSCLLRQGRGVVLFQHWGLSTVLYELGKSPTAELQLSALLNFEIGSH